MKKFGQYVFTVALILILAPAAWSAQTTSEAERLFAEGENFYYAQDYVAAYERLSKAAEQGHASAQAAIGRMYERGFGRQRDDRQALYWFGKAHEGLIEAAEAGNVRAQFFLARMYYNGHVVNQNHGEAFRLHSKAAAAGDKEAQSTLGIMYEYGIGVARNPGQAVYWYSKAAEQGFAVAQLQLGGMYGDGRGVTRDREQAVYWYRKAAEQGLADAQHNLGIMYQSGGIDGIRNYEQAVYWYRKAAEQGDARAQNSLGDMYMGGRGVTRDYEQAAYWYRKAAEQGNRDAPGNLAILERIANLSRPAEQGDAEAQASLGYLYYRLISDYELAVYWFRKAAEQGDGFAQYHLGQSYEYGFGVAKDESRAVYWYRKAIEQGSGLALFSLARIEQPEALRLYEEGRRLAAFQDYASAYDRFSRAAEMGLAFSQNDLGYLYETGRGVTRDTSQAVYWYRKAAEQGHADARSNLARFE